MSKIDLMPDYVECGGVRIPTNWTIPELLAALQKRNVRFTNESDIQAAFQVFHDTKSRLYEQIEALTKHDAQLASKTKQLEETLKKMNKRVTCSKCGNIYTVFDDK